MAALLAPFLIARYIGTDGSWFAAGSMANVFLLLTASPRFQFDWLVSQPYALSITLGVAGLIVVERRTVIGGLTAVALVALAHWVNLAVCVFILPLVLVRGRSIPLAVSTALLGLTAGLLLRTLSTSPPSQTGLLAFLEWPKGWTILLQTSARMVMRPSWLIAGTILALVSGTRLWLNSRSCEPLKTAAIAVFVAAIYWFTIGTFLHVRLNDYDPRYVLPSLLLVDVAISVVIVASLREALRYATSIATVAFIVAAVVTYGFPSPRNMRRAIDRSFGAMTPYVGASGATVIVGDYWVVWPAVFHANLVSYEQAKQVPIFGLTYRSDATDHLWLPGAHRKQIILAGRRDDGTIVGRLEETGIPVKFLGSTGPVVLYRTDYAISQSR